MICQSAGRRLCLKVKSGSRAPSGPSGNTGSSGSSEKK